MGRSKTKQAAAAAKPTPTPPDNDNGSPVSGGPVVVAPVPAPKTSTPVVVAPVPAPQTPLVAPPNAREPGGSDGVGPMPTSELERFIHAISPRCEDRFPIVIGFVGAEGRVTATGSYPVGTLIRTVAALHEGTMPDASLPPPTEETTPPTETPGTPPSPNAPYGPLAARIRAARAVNMMQPLGIIVDVLNLSDLDALKNHPPDAVLEVEPRGPYHAFWRAGPRDDADDTYRTAIMISTRVDGGPWDSTVGVSLPGIYDFPKLISTSWVPMVFPSRAHMLVREFGLTEMRLRMARRAVGVRALPAIPPKIAEVNKFFRKPPSVIESGWLGICPCPDHLSAIPLKLEYIDDDTVLFTCFTGCSHDLVLGFMGLDPERFGLYNEPIKVTADIRAMSDELSAKLAFYEKQIYQKDGSLVRIVRQASSGRESNGIRQNNREFHAIREISNASLMEASSSSSSRWYNEKKTKEGVEKVPVTAPKAVVDAVLSRPVQKFIKSLRGLVETPMFRSDATLLDVPGYDIASALFYAPSCDTPVLPVAPTLDEAKASLDVLLDLISDFPFETSDDRSAWIAALLTAFVRFVFEGPTPLMLITANVRGSGKSMLVDVVSMIHTGRRAARTSYTDDDNEMRKRITAVILEGDRFVLFDNIASTLGGASLDAVLTSTTWKDRILGVSRTTGAMEIVAQWFATGNNTVLRGDTGRRTLYVRLDSPEEHPEDRRGFKYPNLVEHVETHRGELIAACLTILRAYFVAGSPRADIAAWGSFEGWDLLRHVMIWMGQPDPKATQAKTRSKYDEDASALTVFYEEMRKVDRALSAKEILELTRQNLTEMYDAQLRNGSIVPLHAGVNSDALAYAIETLVATRPGQLMPTPRQLGMALTKFEGRVISVVGGKARLDAMKQNNLKKYVVNGIGDTRPPVSELSELDRATANPSGWSESEIPVVTEI